jgi:preprotein translocase subunit SecE
MTNEPHDSDDEPVDLTTPPAEETTTDEAPARGRGADGALAARKPKRQRTSPRQFLREVRSELRKVAWPSRRELLSYSLVVLVSVTLITLYITALDQIFGGVIIRIFGA